MCGIFAVISKNKTEDEILDLLEEANITQSHRGPNSKGKCTITCNDTIVGLAHQRLSILDLSDAGHQPMISSSERYTIIYNGEVYNYLELITEFELRNLNSSSDTEVILELIELIGPSKAIQRFNGMWGIVLVDKVEKTVYISRDRLGIKPVHVFEQSGDIYIASELKTLLPMVQGTASVNKSVIDRFLVHSLQNANDETFIEGITQLSPASIAQIRLDSPKLSIKQSVFWNPLSVELFEGTFDEYCERLQQLINSSVKLRKRADVPVGLCLSGGLDSSIIASVLAKEGKEKLTILSGVSPGHKDSEEPYVDIVSQYLGLNTEKITLNEMTTEELLKELSVACYYNDAPLPSFSSLMFLKLMRVAESKGVKVIYSGQGADELFCGYRKYLFFYLKQLMQKKKFIKLISVTSDMIKNSGLVNQFKLSEAKRYLNKSSDFSVINGEAPKVDFGIRGTLKERQYKDLSSLSVPYLLHYEDRLSMAHGCEIRLPFMDYRVIEFALSAPDHFKMAKGWAKSAVRHAYVGELPDSIIWRKDKQGFVNPQDHILRNKLSRHVYDLIESESALIYKLKLVDRDAYRDLFHKYMNKHPGVWFRQAFAPLSLEIWLQKNKTYLI